MSGGVAVTFRIFGVEADIYSGCESLSNADGLHRS